MLYHMIYRFTSAERDEAQKRFKDTGGANPPSGVKLLARYHFLEGLGGVNIIESDDPQAIGTWVQQWSDILTFQITPVLAPQQRDRAVG